MAAAAFPLVLAPLAVPRAAAAAAAVPTAGAPCDKKTAKRLAATVELLDLAVQASSVQAWSEAAAMAADPLLDAPALRAAIDACAAAAPPQGQSARLTVPKTPRARGRATGCPATALGARASRLQTRPCLRLRPFRPGKNCWMVDEVSRCWDGGGDDGDGSRRVGPPPPGGRAAPLIVDSAPAPTAGSVLCPA